MLVAFDLYGTLLDISGLAASLSDILGRDAAQLLAAWRTAQLERTWELNRLGRYEPFDVVTARALAEVAPEAREDVRARMTAAWLALPPYPDAADCLRRLGGAGVRTGILSNGTRPMIESALRAAQLVVDEVRSVDEVGAYKPDARVYALLPRAGTLFVSANGWDAEGAHRAGLTVCWIDRGGRPPAAGPKLRAVSLAEVAEHAIASAQGR